VQVQRLWLKKQAGKAHPTRIKHAGEPGSRIAFYPKESLPDKPKRGKCTTVGE